MKHLLLTTIAAVVLVGCGNPESALRDAAIEGNIEVVKQHIADGVDVNAPNTYGWTALYYAAGGGHKEIVELLIANGADVNQTSDRGITPLDGAIDPSRGRKFQPFTPPTLDRYPEIADLLRKHGGMTVGELKAIEVVKKHLADGEDVNAIDDGWTPLCEAAYKGHKEMAELLITAGADVNAKDGGGNTPLDWAIKYKRTEVTDFLRKHGGKTAKELKAEGK